MRAREKCAGPSAWTAVRLWRGSWRYNGVERIREDISRTFGGNPRIPSLTTMQFGGTDPGRRTVFSSRLAPASRDSFNTNVQKFAAICRRRMILAFFRALPALVKLLPRVSSPGPDRSVNSLLPAAAADLRRFLGKNFRRTACAKLLRPQSWPFDFPVEQWHSLEQWSKYSASSIFVSPSAELFSPPDDYCLSSCFLSRKGSETM